MTMSLLHGILLTSLKDDVISGMHGGILSKMGDSISHGFNLAKGAVCPKTITNCKSDCARN
jgi:hypothetical protein